MKKTAAQLADRVLEKLALPRWRKKLRRGQLVGTPEAQRLLEEYNWPQRMADAIPKMHAGAGYTEERVPLLPKSTKDLKDLGTTFFSGGASVDAAKKRVLINEPMMEMSMAAIAPKELMRSLNSGKLPEAVNLMRFHEAQEALRQGANSKPFITIKTPKGQALRTIRPELWGAATRSGILDHIPAGLSVPAQNVANSVLQLGGSHNDPKVLRLEREEANLLHPQTQDLFKKMRSESGEFGPGGTAQTSKDMRAIAEARVNAVNSRVFEAREAPLRKLPGLFWQALKSRL